MFNVEVTVNNTLFNAFSFAVKSTYRRMPVKRKIADIKVGTPVFHDGLTFVKAKKNGTVILADGTIYDFMTSVKTGIYTI